MKTVIYSFIIDESGSMSGQQKSVVKSFNDQLRTIREQDISYKNEIHTYVSLTTFNSVIKNRTDIFPIGMFEELTGKDYNPSGATALLDAIGSTIARIEMNYNTKINSLEEVEIVVMILTDGYENSSRKYSFKDISGKIAELEEKGKWRFIFLGADIDAFNVINDLNIKAVNSIQFESEKLDKAMEVVEKSIKNHYINYSKNSQEKDFFGAFRDEDACSDEIMKI
jgi:uncharacterized protein YegL